MLPVKAIKILVSIKVDEGRAVLTYRDVRQDERTRDPISTNARWQLAQGGGFFGMHVLWPYGPGYGSHAWALGMN